MREHKYRIWDDVLEVLFTPEMDDKIKNLWEIPKLQGGVLKTREGILVMKYTGVDDCRNKEVCEGDIVEYNNRIGVVVWHKYQAGFDIEFKKVIEGKPYIEMKGGINPPQWRIYLTVVGNIYENPELL
tara:strand:+ start:4391 stop:4774 length:384 start_codon:yes stop_codon:yes gene_type:complete